MKLTIKKISLIMVLLALPLYAHASMSKKITIVGEVVNIESKYIEIKTKTGNVKVPPSSVVSNKNNLRPGTPVRSRLTWKEFVAAN
jgi:hypothetical protein